MSDSFYMCHVYSVLVRIRWKTKKSVKKVFRVSGVKVAEKLIVLRGTQRDLVKWMLLNEVLNYLRGLLLVHGDENHIN